MIKLICSGFVFFILDRGRTFKNRCFTSVDFSSIELWIYWNNCMVPLISIFPEYSVIKFNIFIHLAMLTVVMFICNIHNHGYPPLLHLSTVFSGCRNPVVVFDGVWRNFLIKTWCHYNTFLEMVPICLYLNHNKLNQKTHWQALTSI